MFDSGTDEGYENVLPGIVRKTLVHGENTLLTEFRLEKGHTLPHHSHPHEQTGYLVTGHVKLTIGNERFDVSPGGSWCIPGGVSHGAEVLKDSVAIEVFSPVREDYIQK